MKRREFIKLSSFSIIPVLAACNGDKKTGYDIEVSSDMFSGHSVFESRNLKKGADYLHDILIVGGGISGLAAACHLQEKDFILCELSGRLGGTSGGGVYQGLVFAQGAHYDLAYPDNFGEGGIRLLKELDIISYNSFSKMWEFREKNYIIDPAVESRCYGPDGFRPDVIPDVPEREEFRKILSEFKGAMKMPTRLIDPSFHFLNQQSFSGYLNSRMNFGGEFAKGVDYNMTDDYGGTAGEVSALAGIHYYMCRPYFTQPVELFSPPQGNYYFIEKMAGSINPSKIKTGFLVKNIIMAGNSFQVEAINFNEGTLETFRVNKIIYAGTKHALKYIYPRDYPLFEKNIYAPWMVINFILNEFPGEESFWQNEIVGRHSGFLGFVDSGSQYNPGVKYRVLSAYYCFKPEQRQLLADIEVNKHGIVHETSRIISDYFGSDITRFIHKAFIRVMGHAMPVPVKNYLFNDKNNLRTNPNLVYAGVDNSRLPLLFEAIDSGIEAAHTILNS